MASTSSTHRSTSAHACQAWASIQHTDFYYNLTRTATEKYIYPYLSSGHQVVVTTNGFGYSGPHCDASNCTSFQWPVPEYNAHCHCDKAFNDYCAENARKMVGWGEADERIAAVWPFFWYSMVGSVGLQDLHGCQDEWRRLFEGIIKPPGGRPPPRRLMGKPREARTRCAGRLAPDTPPPLEGVGSWCSRE